MATECGSTATVWVGFGESPQTGRIEVRCTMPVGHAPNPVLCHAGKRGQRAHGNERFRWWTYGNGSLRVIQR